MVKDFVEKNEEFFVQFGQILLKHQRDVARVSDSADARDQAAQNFARYLRAARANAGLNTSELADKANIPQAVMYALERGLIFSKSIQANWLHRLADALDEDIETFGLLLDCDIPPPGLAGVPAKTKNDWRAAVAYFGSLAKALLALALMLLTLFSSALFIYPSDSQELTRFITFPINGGSATPPMTSQMQPPLSLAQQLVGVMHSAMTPGIALPLISLLLLLLLWVAIKSKKIPSKISLITTPRWQNGLVYATFMLLICMFATHSLYAADVNSDDNQEIFSTEDSSTHRNARIIYVNADATGANDGTSWADAYTDLQDALAAATASDEIFVAADTYRPTDNGDRTVSFQLKNGVALYGGFNGNETTRDERDWDANSTILSGDLSGDDNENVAHDEPTRADNSYHVVRAISIDDTAKLDGFTITGGNGNVPDDGTNNDSGGMRNDSSSPTLSNLVFMNNSAIYGGGMSNLSGSSPTLVHVTFNNNVANAAGGMLNEHNSNPTLLHVIFTSNCTSIYHRVGMYNDNSYPILNHVTFTGHSTGGNGGGIYNNQSRPIITDATFTSNVAVDDGGGMYNYQSSPTVRNATFTGNSVSNDGGGMYNSESRAALSHVTFTGNSAHDGGGMFNNNSNPTVINGVFNNNSAPYGGGMYNIRRHSTVSNVTFTGDVLRENFLTSTIEIVSNNWHTNHTAFQAPGGGKLDAQTILDSVAERRGQVWWSVGCQTGPVMPNDSNGVTAVEIARSHNGGWEDYICRLKNYGLAMGEDELIRANPGSTSSWRAWAVASDLQIDCNSISQPDTTAPSWKKCGPSASSIASYLSNMDSGQNTNSVLLYMSPILVSILLGVMSSVVISDGQIILSLRSGK